MRTVLWLCIQMLYDLTGHCCPSDILDSSLFTIKQIGWEKVERVLSAPSAFEKKNLYPLWYIQLPACFTVKHCKHYREINTILIWFFDKKPYRNSQGVFCSAFILTLSNWQDTEIYKIYTLYGRIFSKAKTFLSQNTDFHYFLLWGFGCCCCLGFFFFCYFVHL